MPLFGVTISCGIAGHRKWTGRYNILCTLPKELEFKRRLYSRLSEWKFLARAACHVAGYIQWSSYALTHALCCSVFAHAFLYQPSITFDTYWLKYINNTIMNTEYCLLILSTAIGILIIMLIDLSDNYYCIGILWKSILMSTLLNSTTDWHSWSSKYRFMNLLNVDHLNYQM